MSWIFLTKTKHPPLEHVCLFLRTFGRSMSLGGFIRCDQGGKLARSHAFIDMALTEFGYKVEPTGADSPSRHSPSSPSVEHLHASYSSRIRRSPTESQTEASHYLVATSSHNRISTNSATDGLLNLLSLRIYPKPLIEISSLMVTFGTL